MHIRPIISILLIILSGCDKQPVINNHSKQTEKKNISLQYLIRKGNHSIDENPFTVIQSDSIRCEVLFDSTAAYQTVSTENQEDVNKLIGFSDCNSHHQQNSARLGWSWNGKSVVLYAYAYVNNERIVKTLTTVSLNQRITCSLKAIDGNYYFEAGAVKDSIPRYCSGYSRSRYKLYPYFGGDETAPHDIRIEIKEFY